ncbi:MAG TPA: hypothetical protein VGO31_10450 [Microbacteriaceae bacterium]|jgi:hypothetical protein|nr:hypothetical protein [Microbacteriaceae bacterium]
MKRPVRQTPVRVIDDPELLELFENEPELLAITDALQATQARRRSVAGRPLFLAAALVAVAAIAAGAVTLIGRGGPSLVEEAAAALPKGRMIEATLETSADSAVVDLSSGTARPVTVVIQSWLDSSTGRMRVITRRGGVVVSDVAGEGSEIAPAASGLDPSSLTFARLYKRAVTGGHASALSNRELEIAAGGASARVRLSADHLPAQVVASGGRTWRVTNFQATPFNDAAFTPGRTGRAVHAGRVASSKPLRFDAARTAAARVAGTSVPLKLGQSVMTRASLQQLTRESGTRSTRGTGFEFVYGVGAGKILVRVARRPEMAYGFTEGRLVFDFNPIPPAGEANVVAVGARASKTWIVQLRLARGFATIRARTRALGVGAAQQLARA